MKKLFLITQFYPFENNEEPFIFPELLRLKEKFDVTIIAADIEEKTEIKANVPSDVRVVGYSRDDMRFVWNYYKTIGYKFSKICNKAKDSGEFNKRYYAKGKTFECWFRKQKFVEKNEPFVFYSYWFSWWNLGIADNKAKYPYMRMITRAQGYDLYDERHRDGKQPFRKFLDSKMDKVFFISEKGKEYYLKNQANEPLQSEKYIVSYLGQDDYCGNVIEKSKGDIFTIVSCSNVIPLKRVELIAKALAEVKNTRHIRWVHFGDGLSMDNLKNEVAKTLLNNSNITVEIKGRVTNKEVLEFYKTDRPDVFITTSSTEGLPVSISEAMSFGIPIIATNVGGISEQIEGNGILLSANPEIFDVADAINKILIMDESSLCSMSQASRNIWEQKFRVDDNVEMFIEAIS